jgi:hypothetical protein
MICIRNFSEEYKTAQNNFLLTYVKVSCKKKVRVLGLQSDAPFHFILQTCLL